jgi:threonine synthase
MGKVFANYGYVCDPHTASGWAAAENYVNQTGDTRAMVVLSTASPYKFPEAVLRAIGQEPAGDGFDQMEQLCAATNVAIPKNLANLRTKAERHTGVIGKGEMLEFVLGL